MPAPPTDSSLRRPSRADPARTEPTREDLIRALATHSLRDHAALPGRTNHLRAGVLVPIVWGPHPTVLVTLRPDHLRTHAGEYCFPGGSPEPEDADLEATARREAMEELGLRSIDIVGRLSSMPLYTSDFRLEPFVGLVDETELAPDPSEVAAVRRVRLDELVSKETHEGIGYRYKEHEGVSPVFAFDDRWMYGATAMTFWELVVAVAPLFGQRPPRLVAGDLTFADVFFKDGATVGYER